MHLYVAQADYQFRYQHSNDLVKTNSLVFNAFIFMQVRPAHTISLKYS